LLSFFSAINIRLTKEELHLVGANMTNRVQVNGGDYLGSIGVYHHLHCLNNLRMVVHWDYYKSKWADYAFPEQFDVGHSGYSTLRSAQRDHFTRWQTNQAIDHCINTLRQAIMCHPNTAITTFEWVDEVNPLEGKEQKLEAMATCAKWESIDNWARKKALVKGQFTYRPGPFAMHQPDHSNHE
jgi:hypothetical protein